MFLIVIGCLFVLAGLFALCANIYLQLRPPGNKKGFAGDVGQWADLVNALAKLPNWALSVVLGLGLIWAGEYIGKGHLPGA